MAKCRGCGGDTREYDSPGLGWMHYRCEIERLDSLAEEQIGLVNGLVEELATARREERERCAGKLQEYGYIFSAEYLRALGEE